MALQNQMKKAFASFTPKQLETGKKGDGAGSVSLDILPGSSSGHVREIAPVRHDVVAPRRYGMLSWFHGWVFHAVILSPMRTKRAAAWLWLLPAKLSLFVRTIMGPKVADDVWRARMDDCERCTNSRIRLSIVKGEVVEKSYCKQCGCPDWYLSRLDNKNRYAKWECPLRTHEGPYEDDLWRPRATELSGGEVVRNRTGGCGG